MREHLGNTRVQLGKAFGTALVIGKGRTVCQTELRSRIFGLIYIPIRITHLIQEELIKRVIHGRPLKLNLMNAFTKLQFNLATTSIQPFCGRFHGKLSTEPQCPGTDAVHCDPVRSRESRISANHLETICSIRRNIHRPSSGRT